MHVFDQHRGGDAGGSGIWFGGDYNPEQWSDDVWVDDLELMREAGVSMVTVGVFAWSTLEPTPGVYDFGWLDRVLDGLHGAGIRVDLATGTASPPPWLTHQHPEVLPVTASGVRLAPGARQAYCPSAPAYRSAASALVTRLVDRYAGHPAVEWWHVNNEYACHVNRCYCDETARAFRDWLSERYGTIASLNDAWGTSFWSQRYSDFAEVLPPRLAPTSGNPAHMLDFDRFSSEESLGLLRMEAEIIRARDSHPVTTNFMGFFKPLDYWRWARELDVISDDCYPDPADPRSPMLGAMAHDLSRSLAGGKPWVLMEQAVSAVNWRAVNAAKRPGVNRAWSLQSVARGADAVLFFQWRQSASGSEKFHSALLPHAGPDTRVFRDAVGLGAELAAIPRGEDASIGARVALVLDWESWWAIEQEAMPTTVDYAGALAEWYRPFFERTVPVDFVPPDRDLSGYALVIASHLLVVSARTSTSLAEYVERGGSLVMTWLSGILDENLRVDRSGYLPGLRTVLGVRVEEFWPLTPEHEGVRIVGGPLDGELAVAWAEIAQATDAEVVSCLVGGDLDSGLALTRHAYGEGEAWYLAAGLRASGMDALVAALLERVGIDPVVRDPVPDIEAVARAGTIVLINHGDVARDVYVDAAVGQFNVGPHDVKFVRAMRRDGVDAPDDSASR